MSKMKDLQITLDEARELIEKFAEEHTDVHVAFNKSRVNMLFFSVTIRDKKTTYGCGHMFDANDLCTKGLSYLENTLNEFYDNVVKVRKELNK